MNGHGVHKMSIPNSNGRAAFYIGTFRDNRREGNGEFLSSDGTRYFGQWKNNVKDGFGMHFNNAG